MNLKINLKINTEKNILKKNLVPLNKELIKEIVTVTSKAAISCYKFLGKNDKISADRAATDSMRNEINKIQINGKL